MNLVRIIFFIIISFCINLNVYAEPVHKNDYDVVGQVGIPTGVIFNPSGTKMYVTGFNGNSGRIAQYSLSVPYSTSSGVSLDANIITEIAAVLKRPQDIKFNSDGSKVLILSTSSVDGNQDSVAIWSLGTPYDITTIISTGVSEIPLSNDPRGFDFNTDGTKMFILLATTNQIEQFDLTTPYDPSDIDITLPKATLSNLKGDSYHQGFGFSSDGYKMFVIKADRDSDDTELNIIEEYDLTTPFEITTANKNEKTYNTQTASEGNMRIAGITFNFGQGANKFYHLDFDDNKLVREYDLPCAYGIISCMNPTSNKDDVGSVEAQSEVSKKLIQHTTYPVLNRMEWLRRNKDSSNLTNQNIKFQFSNEILASLSNLITPSSLTSNNTSTAEPQFGNWSYWSEGTVSVGKVGDTGASSAKNINSSAITIGADRRNDKNRMFGFAFRFGSDDIDVGNLGSALDMNALSLTVYETRPKGKNMFMDSLIGISAINTNLLNNSGSISTDGEREGKQIFASIKFRETFTKEKLNITPNIKLDLGFTSLSDYTETGAEGLNLKFNRQDIGTVITSIGSVIDNTINIDNGIIKPNIQLEYNADISPSSKQEFEYASNGTSYILENINSSTHNYRGSFGFDLITDNGFSLMTSYERNQSKGNGHSDNIYFGGSYISKRNETYAFSLDGSETFNTKLDYKRDLNGIGIKVSSNYSLMSEIPDYGATIEVSNKF